MSRRLVATALVLWTSSAFGQGIAVQQPVLESFSVGSTTGVPDRGAVMLGGVGRASSGRAAFGPLSGRRASDRRASSLSAGVFIHDFEAMDAAVLGAANGSAPRPAFTKSRYSDATSYEMARRFGTGGGRQPFGTTVNEPAAGPPSSPAGDVDRMLSLGQAAERRGKPGVATIHYRIAAKRGSAEAARRLAMLSNPGAVAAEGAR